MSLSSFSTFSHIMDKWKETLLSKEEEEGVTAKMKEVGGEEIF